ncbi:sulfite exporter TauE/SafE family protein [Novipirellula sp.]|uniref:sulfite exporter TauE/SafE family protein n=1 Tax=Novipirellula sp. TaxID=2795430 RepID=UPI0035652F1A
MEWLWYLLLMVAGFLAGIINTIAGGGSFLTLPALMLFGLDPKLANGTNRVAILLSSAAAVATFRRHGQFNQRLAFRLAVPTLLGVPVGALMAIYLPTDTFKSLFGVMFLAMAVLLCLNPKRLTQINAQPENLSWKMLPIFFAIGIYVGFIQAGLGILLMLAMSLLNTGDLVASSAIKNWIAFIVTLTATIVFVSYGLVQWAPGLVMAIGNVAGGVMGAKLAIRKGNRFVFVFLVIVMVATGVKLTFF